MKNDNSEKLVREWKIRIDRSAANIHFASLVADIISTNMEKHPSKKSSFEAMKGTAVLEVVDQGVTLKLVFGGGVLVISRGVSDDADVAVRVDSETFMRFCNSRQTHGLAGLPQARLFSTLKMMFAGKVGIGVRRSPLFFIRLLSLISAGS